jgi:hypothetical protein
MTLSAAGFASPIQALFNGKELEIPWTPEIEKYQEMISATYQDKGWKVAQRMYCDETVLLLAQP